MASQSASASAPAAAAPSAPAAAAPAAGGATRHRVGDDDRPLGHGRRARGGRPQAFDGNPATFWYTQTYKRADFAGFKPAVGYAITLTTKTTVHTVTLHSNSTGGHVEVRATDAAHPMDGPVLASGSFGPETALTLTPPTGHADPRPVDHGAPDDGRRVVPPRADRDHAVLTGPPVRVVAGTSGA